VRVRRWAGAGVVVCVSEAALTAAAAGWSAAGGACSAGFAAGWSAGWVTVPLRLKFSSELGPTVLAVGGVSWAGADAGASWASAAVGANASALANNAYLKRETAFICSRRSRVDSRQFPEALQAHAHRFPRFQAQVR
jgi:hypothetical protein